MKKTFFTQVMPVTALLAFASLSIGQDDSAFQASIERIKQTVPKEPHVKPEKARKLLIFTVTNGWKHPSIPVGTAAFRIMGEETGAYEPVVSNDLSNFEKENISEYAAICFLNTTGEPFSPSKEALEAMNEEEKKEAAEYSDELKESFMNFVKNGGGFVGIHSATDTFYEWPEYGEMINGYFDGHPWNSDMDVSVKVEPGKEKHRLVSMFEGENLEFKEEIYQLKDPYDSSEVDMVLRLDTEKTNMDVKGVKRTDGDFGVAWSRPWGKGRVFYSSLGHNEHIYMNNKVMRHYLAGIQYAIGDYDLNQGTSEKD